MTTKEGKDNFFWLFYVSHHSNNPVYVHIRSFIWLFHKSAYVYISPKCRYVVAPVLYSSCTCHVDDFGQIQICITQGEDDSKT
jgi:hypothetical protein